MDSMQVIDELTELCKRQAELIRKQADALAQVGAAIIEEGGNGGASDWDSGRGDRVRSDGNSAGGDSAEME